MASRLFQGLFCVGLLLFVASSNVYANEYQLRQEILPVPCESTPDAPVCPMSPPTVGAVSSNNGRPFLTGLYDANKSVRLLVEVAGKVYELGIDSELTSLNGAWTLDLTELITPLVSGGYEILVTSIDSNGNEARGNGQLIVEHVVSGAVDETEGGQLSDTGQAVAITILIAAIIIVFASAQLIYLRSPGD